MRSTSNMRAVDRLLELEIVKRELTAKETGPNAAGLEDGVGQIADGVFADDSRDCLAVGDVPVSEPEAAGQ